MLNIFLFCLLILAVLLFTFLLDIVREYFRARAWRKGVFGRNS